jgi:hypothetical protein
LEKSNIAEGQVRQISINPILALAGYHQPPIELQIEEGIQRIDTRDRDTHIQGRLDILVVNRKVQTVTQTLLWVLMIESKNIDASEFPGTAPMLTYAHESLAHQSAVWGLVTHGATYQFFYIQKGDTLTYQYLPRLSLTESDPSCELIQVLTAIRDWQP